MEEKSLRDRMKEITDVLEKGIRDVFDSGAYETYLKTMSRFHGNSMNNTLLIYLQKPDATRVAGYQAWQRKFHRSVRKGEKGIRILAPCPFKKNGSGRRFYRFRRKWGKCPTQQNHHRSGIPPRHRLRRKPDFGRTAARTRPPAQRRRGGLPGIP